MGDSAALYNELKDDMQSIMEPLIDLAEQQVRRYGTFLPFGASLDDTGQVALKAAGTKQETASSVEILPILHDWLRVIAADRQITAIAVCEWVRITPEGGSQTDAVKVLVEHRRGLTVAFYRPCRRRLLRGWTFGETMALPAQPEVRPWGTGDAP